MVVYVLNDLHDSQKFIADTCNVEAVFKKVIKHCRDAYSWTDDDTKDYLNGLGQTDSRQHEEALPQGLLHGRPTRQRNLPQVDHFGLMNLSMQPYSVIITYFEV